MVVISFINFKEARKNTQQINHYTQSILGPGVTGGVTGN